MIVECGKCGTRFQLDDARVPESGIRVRCSRCKEAFFLQHPSATPAEVVQDVVERTVEEPEAAPASAHDLRSDPQTGDSPSGVEDEGFEYEEEDWEFNDERPESDAAGDDEGPAAGGLSDDDSFPIGDDDSFPSSEDESLQLADDDDFDTIPGLGGNEPPGSEDFGELDEAPPSQPAASYGQAPEAAAPEPDLASLADERDVFGSPADFSALSDPEPPAAVVAAAEPAFSDLLGDSDSDDPEDWNFLTEEPARTRAAPVGRVNLTTRGALDAQLEQTAAALEEDDGVTGPLTGGARHDLARRVGQGVGWLLTAGLFAVGAIQGLSLTMPSAEAPAQPIRLGGLTVDGITGSWIETARGEALYAVRGGLVNSGARALMPQAAVEVSLLDSDGQPLALPAVLAVAELEEAELREQFGEAMLAARDRAGRDFAATRVGPGQRLAFVALFDAPPAEASAFQVREAPLPVRAEAVLPAPAPAMAEPEPFVPDASPVPVATGASPGGGSLPPAVE